MTNELKKIKNEIDDIIQNVSETLGKQFPRNAYSIIIKDKGKSHLTEDLPKEKMGVYAFYYKENTNTPGIFLKIGKAGPNSNARWKNQHYDPHSSKSNLSKSLLTDNSFKNKTGINEQNVGQWIKDNTQRIEIIMDYKALGIFALELVESSLHYKYEPKYEGYETQR